jgi:hypothetical protein
MQSVCDRALRQQAGRSLLLPAALFINSLRNRPDGGRCRDSQDVRGQTAPRSRGSLILARGPLRPPLHPPDQGFPPVDPARGAPPSGHPARSDFISPSTLDHGAFLPPWTPDQRETSALPLDTHRPGVCRHGPHQGFRALDHDRCSGSGFGAFPHRAAASVRPCGWRYS